MKQRKKTASQKQKLPLFPNLPPYRSMFRKLEENEFNDEFLQEIIASRPMQRLKKIGFLGALDYVVGKPNGSEPHRRRHNRFEHSLGVANLAIIYAKQKQLDEKCTRLLAAAGLLHDIGHAPLSHSLEPIFKQKLGINHHTMGMDILYGRENLGRRLPAIFRRFKIDIDEIAAMIKGKHDGEHGFLFASPINLDTIEGINRSKAFFTKWKTQLSPRKLVKSMASAKQLPVPYMDEFWLLKNEVYKFFIHHKAKIIFDALAQAYLAKNIRRFSKLDFLKTEEELKQDHPSLFQFFNMRKACEIEPSILKYKLKIPNRCFIINYDVEIKTATDLAKRYSQQKQYQNITLAQLL